jgi:hypothetical protein
VQHKCREQHHSNNPKKSAKAKEALGELTQVERVGINLLGAAIDVEIAQHVQDQKQEQDAPGNGHDNLLANRRRIELQDSHATPPSTTVTLDRDDHT